MKTDGGIVAVRGTLYFLIAVLTPLAAVYGECAQYHYWPDAPSIMYALLSGLLAGLVAVRAYLDGSAERWRTGGRA